MKRASEFMLNLACSFTPTFVEKNGVNKNFIPKEAVVKRNGVWTKLAARLIVPGDLI